MLVLLVLLQFYSRSNADTIETTYNISDDGYVNVPLQFPFPFYDQVFTNSWMFSNGVIGFLNPLSGVNGGQTFISSPFSTLDSSRFKFMIMPLWTDLINYGSGEFKTISTETQMTYIWNNISEYGLPNNLNTFDVTINNIGNIVTNYTNINITQHPIGVGYIGDLTLGQSEQTGWFPYGASYTINELINWSANPSLGINICTSSPLTSPLCPGYAEAYAQLLYTQNCSLDPLYDSGCPGYAEAYFNQQCSLDPLYDKRCPGYTEAYVLNNIITQTNTDTDTESIASISITETIESTITTESTTSATSTTISAISPIAVVNVITSTMPSTFTNMPIIIESTVKDNKTETNKNTEETKEKVKESVKKEAAKLAEKIGNSVSLEEQKNIQNQILALIGFNPDFTNYKTALTEIQFYNQPQIQDKKIFQSKTSLRNGLAQQILHTKMVDMQFMWYK